MRGSGCGDGIMGMSPNELEFEPVNLQLGHKADYGGEM